MEGPYRKFAQEFLPAKIRYLLIGESPPFTPPGEQLKYFYNYKNTGGSQILLSTVCYAFLGRKFYRKNGDKKRLLNMLKKKGAFLLDATYEPINKTKDPKIRQKKIQDAFPALKGRIRKLSLTKSAKILLLHGNVIRAIGNQLREDFKDTSWDIYDIGFPSYYYDEKFRKKVKSAVIE